MLTLSPEAKQAYAKYVGPDGRLIIDENLPNDVKEAFQFFNSNNINILTLNVNEPIEFSEEQTIDEEELENQIDTDEEDELSENSIGSGLGEEIQEDDSQDISSLEDLF